MVCATTTSGGTRGESDGQTSQTQIEIQTAHNKAHRATYSPSRRERYIYLKKSSSSRYAVDPGRGTRRGCGCWRGQEHLEYGVGVQSVDATHLDPLRHETVPRLAAKDGDGHDYGSCTRGE